MEPAIEGPRSADGPPPFGPEPVRGYSGAVRLVRKLEKHPGVFTAAALALYAAGFIVANVHYARFRLLTFDLLRGQYLAAGILFLIFTAAPVLCGLIVPALVVRRVREPGPRLRRAKNAVSGAALGIMLCLIAGVGISYLYDAITVGPAGTVAYFNVAFGYSLVYSGIGIMTTIMIVTGHGREPPATAPASLPGIPPLQPMQRFIVRLIEAPMYLVMVAIVASIFGERVYPGIEPDYGGGGAWIAEILTPGAPGGVVPDRWRGAVLTRDDTYLAVIPCPGTVGASRVQKPIELQLDKVVGWTLLGSVNPEKFVKGKSTAQCTEAQ